MKTSFARETTSTPQTISSSALPATLPGIDVKNGLRMCNGNPSLYREMLQKFQTTKRNDPSEIQTLLEAGDHETAGRMAHGMKSVAGILGAADLAAAAYQLEEAIAKNMDNLLEARLQDYSQALALIIRGLDSAFVTEQPLFEEYGEKDVHDQGNVRHPLPGSETILLAEDDHMVMLSTTDILEANGYKVFKAYDGAEAVEVFEKHQDQIDLIIMDAIMPKLTGKQAWDKICSIRSDVKCCFVSGYITDIIGGKLAIDYSLPFIGKPVVPETLLLVVRNILDGTSG